MPPKKGLSAAAKKQKLLEFFNKDHEFYSIKEIENLGSKFSGISSMQIKDVLQELIDDGLVNVEKCGQMNIYWCFKFDIKKKLLQQFDRSNRILEGLHQEKQVLLNNIEQSKADRTNKFLVDGVKQDRGKLLAKLEETKKINYELTSTIELLSNNSPAKLQKMNDNLKNLKYYAETFTDNIEILIYYFSQKSSNPIPSSVLRKEFNIPEEFEDLPNIIL